MPMTSASAPAPERRDQLREQPASDRGIDAPELAVGDDRLAHGDLGDVVGSDRRIGDQLLAEEEGDRD